jgi:hypothetical protein
MGRKSSAGNLCTSSRMAELNPHTSVTATGRDPRPSAMVEIMRPTGEEKSTLRLDDRCWQAVGVLVFEIVWRAAN